MKDVRDTNMSGTAIKQIAIAIFHPANTRMHIANANNLNLKI